MRGPVHVKNARCLQMVQDVISKTLSLFGQNIFEGYCTYSFRNTTRSESAGVTSSKLWGQVSVRRDANDIVPPNVNVTLT